MRYDDISISLKPISFSASPLTSQGRGCFSHQSTPVPVATHAGETKRSLG